MGDQIWYFLAKWKSCQADGWNDVSKATLGYDIHVPDASDGLLQFSFDRLLITFTIDEDIGLLEVFQAQSSLIPLALWGWTAELVITSEKIKKH